MKNLGVFMGLDVVYPCLAQATSVWPEPCSLEKCQAQAIPFNRSARFFYLSFGLFDHLFGQINH